jgi:hypothetical protein
MKKIIVFISILLVSVFLIPHSVSAKGGGARGGSARPAARPSTPTVKTTPTPVAKPSPVTAPAAPKVTPPKAPSVKPSTATKTVTSPSKKTVGSKTYSNKGYVVDKDFAPKFRGGYTAPVGSTVYYRDSGIMDWLPFYLIMSNQQHREAVVSTPGENGAAATEKVVQEEGTDPMYILNWVITILFLGGVIAGIAYLINKRSSKPSYV